MTFRINRNPDKICVWLYDIKWIFPIQDIQYENGTWNILKWPIGIPNSLKPSILNQINQEEYTC